MSSESPQPILSTFDEKAKLIADLGADHLVCIAFDDAFRNLTPESFAEAKKLGLLVSVWTPDTSDDLSKLIAMKVDAITTNRPDVLKKLLADRK